MTHHQPLPPGRVELRLRGLPEDVARTASVINFFFFTHSGKDRPDRDEPTVRRFCRVGTDAAEAAADRRSRDRRKLALLLALCETYPKLTAFEIRQLVLDSDLTDDEIAKKLGADIAARFRDNLKDGSR